MKCLMIFLNLLKVISANSCFQTATVCIDSFQRLSTQSTIYFSSTQIPLTIDHAAGQTLNIYRGDPSLMTIPDLCNIPPEVERITTLKISTVAKLNEHVESASIDLSSVISADRGSSRDRFFIQFYNNVGNCQVGPLAGVLFSDIIKSDPNQTPTNATNTTNGTTSNDLIRNSTKTLTDSGNSTLINDPSDSTITNDPSNRNIAGETDKNSTGTFENNGTDIPRITTPDATNDTTKPIPDTSAQDTKKTLPTPVIIGLVVLAIVLAIIALGMCLAKRHKGKEFIGEDPRYVDVDGKIEAGSGAATGTAAVASETCTDSEKIQGPSSIEAGAESLTPTNQISAAFKTALNDLPENWREATPSPPVHGK